MVNNQACVGMGLGGWHSGPSSQVKGVLGPQEETCPILMISGIDVFKKTHYVLVVSFHLLVSLRVVSKHQTYSDPQFLCETEP